MNWNNLESLAQLQIIDDESQSGLVLIFKHSTRCSICVTALNRLERKWKDSDSEKIKPYYLDLLQHRDVSNAIAERYGIEHQSPQVLLISKGKCVYSATHLEIFYEELVNKV